jgi:hypothetical protein
MRPRFLAAAARVADAILVATAIALVFVSLLLVRRGWTSLRDGAMSPRDLLFLAAPIALATLLLAGLRLEPVCTIQLVLALIYFVKVRLRFLLKRVLQAAWTTT